MKIYNRKCTDRETTAWKFTKSRLLGVGVTNTFKQVAAYCSKSSGHSRWAGRSRKDRCNANLRMTVTISSELHYEKCNNVLII